MTEAKESTKRALPKTSIKSVQREIASLMIGEEMGIGHDPGQHAAYVGRWILCEDPKEILRASRDAEQINRYVLALEKDCGLAEKEACGTEIDQVAREKTPQRRAGRAR